MNVPDNIVICINKTNNLSVILPQLETKKCYNIDCSDNWREKRKKAVENIEGCECEYNNCLECSDKTLFNKNL